MSDEAMNIEVNVKTQETDISQLTQIADALSNLEFRYLPKDYQFLLSIYNQSENKELKLTSETHDNVIMVLNRYWDNFFNPKYSTAASYDQEADIDERENAIKAYSEILANAFIKTKKISYAKVCYNLGYCYAIEGLYADAIKYLKIAAEKYKSKNKDKTLKLIEQVKKWQDNPLSVYDDEESTHSINSNSPSSSSSSTSSTTTTPLPQMQSDEVTDKIKSQQDKIAQLENIPDKSPKEKKQLAKLCLKVGFKFAQAGKSTESDIYTKKLNEHYADACQSVSNSTIKIRQ